MSYYSRRSAPVERKTAEEFWGEKAALAAAFERGEDSVAQAVKRATYVEPVVES